MAMSRKENFGVLVNGVIIRKYKMQFTTFLN